MKIPKNDVNAWELYPDHRWIYNKLLLCEYQGIPCAPMPIKPINYPVVIKPIVNLYGMGLDAVKVNNLEEFEGHWLSTKFWSQYFRGEHLSWDIVMLSGEIKFHTCFKGHKGDSFGTFKLWESVHMDLPDVIKGLILDKFKDYSGCLNCETIGDKIIECHLRMGDIDLFLSDKLKEGITAVYDGKEYDFSKVKLERIYLFPIWGDENDWNKYDKINKKLTKLLETHKNIIQYHIDSPQLANPLDKHRLLWFTTNDKEKGQKIIRRIYRKINDIN